MLSNKITLAFPENEEKGFRQEYYSNSLLQFRVAFILSIFLYGAFGYVDSQLIPEYAKLFHSVRYLFVIPILTLVLLISFTEIFKKIWQFLLFVSVISGGVGIIVMIMVDPDNYYYYAGMMLIYSACYFFIKLRFILATAAGWLLLLIFNLGAVYYARAPYNVILSYNFFFISANLIGMFGAFYMEYYTRRNYFLSRKLENEKLLVLDVNRNLEKLVEERTGELLKAKMQAEESDRLKSAFLANMSHEIRTPMNGILGFSELLKQPGLSGDQQQEYIKIIEKSGARMLNIINDIVDISKIEAGLMKTDIKESNVNDQIEYIYTFFEPEAKARKINFVFNTPLPAREAVISTDREKVYAILTNLVKNALKYTEKGSIELGYEVDKTLNPPFLKFYVKDTGIGIPSNRQEAIFERFIQADIADKMARQGAGLGLSISRAYVEMLDGKIWVESSEGEGSVFYFTLPFSKLPVNESGLRHTGDTGKIFSIKKLNILVADDDEVSFELIRNTVLMCTQKILSAKTGSEAVDLCRQNTDVDLILMDIRMPEMTGFEAAQKIREFDKDVVIIAQTALGLAGDREKAIKSGCNDYIKKPIASNELLTLIQNYFKE